HHDGESRAGEGLGVPSIVPLVAEASLRAAVHEESDRVFLITLESGRLHDVAEHVVVVRAGEVELLVLAELALGELALIQVSELCRLAAIEAHGVEVGRTCERREGVEHALSADAEPLDLTVAGDRGCA